MLHTPFLTQECENTLKPNEISIVGCETLKAVRGDLAAAARSQVCRAAWRKYIQTGVLDTERVRPEVGASWQRCRNLNLDPYNPVIELLNPIELRARVHKNQHLIEVAIPAMDNLAKFVNGSGFQIVLTDESGYLLEVLGDESIVSSTRSVHLCPGGSWNETSKGTNAIGTAIFERRPVQIHGAEHYCAAHHFLTCSAAPIFDPDGQMIGVLNLTGDHRGANAHTLGMVVAASNAIENQLRLESATSKLRLASRYSNLLLEHMSDGLISVDSSGVITELNARGGELLGVSPDRVKGRHISEVHLAQGPLIRVLGDTARSGAVELMVSRTGRRLSASASLLRDEAGTAVGAVAVIREAPNRRSPIPFPTLNAPATFDDIAGESAAMRSLKQWAIRAAKSPSTILINGETGTGKELFAQAIHNASSRADGPFVALNCAALPETLVESELFGYEDGTFTGAKKGGHPGKFEMANGGTIFLDEVGDMPLAAQAKLLRVIQEKKVVRLGDATERPIDIRIIAATHTDLRDAVRRGAFRQDLYYRLHVLEVRIPPLRERLDDLPTLTEHIVRRIGHRVGRSDIRMDDAFLREIRGYDWPGNVRELENAVERAIVAAGDDGLLRVPLVPGAELASADSACKRPQEIRPLTELEREMIANALTFYDGNIQRASAKLGICRNTLYKKMREYKLA